MLLCFISIQSPVEVKRSCVKRSYVFQSTQVSQVHPPKIKNHMSCACITSILVPVFFPAGELCKPRCYIKLWLFHRVVYLWCVNCVAHGGGDGS